MNPNRRAQNVYQRWKKDGRVGLIPEIARAIRAAYEEGIRNGAACFWDDAVRFGVVDEGQPVEARKDALSKAYHSLVKP